MRFWVRWGTRFLALIPCLWCTSVHAGASIPPEALTQAPRHPVVVSVAGEQGREEIRAAMREMGFRELRDFVCAA